MLRNTHAAGACPAQTWSGGTPGSLPAAWVDVQKARGQLVARARGGQLAGRSAGWTGWLDLSLRFGRAVPPVPRLGPSTILPLDMEGF